MKFCKDCKHYKASRFYVTLYSKCYAPENGHNDVTGEIEEEYCSISREFSNMCGKEGKYFILKNSEHVEDEKPKTIWERIHSFFS